MYLGSKIANAVDSIYGYEYYSRPTFEQTMRIFAMPRENINALRGEVMTIRGYPAYLDHTGHLSRIDHALLGWIEMWNKLAPDLSQRALSRLHRKLLNGIAIEEQELDAALAEMDRQQARFMTLTNDFLKQVNMDQLIAIELDRLRLRKDREWV